MARGKRRTVEVVRRTVALSGVVSGIREGTREMDRWQRKAVKAARKQGLSWEQIGAACGVSRQAAWERFSSD